VEYPGDRAESCSGLGWPGIDSGGPSPVEMPPTRLGAATLRTVMIAAARHWTGRAMESTSCVLVRFGCSCLGNSQHV
jgi:hypothetical protein